MVALPKTFTSYSWKTYNMKEIITRSLSGALYVTLLLASIYTSQYIFQGVFFLFGLVALYEFKKLIHLKNWILYIIFTVCYAFFIFTEVPDYIILGVLGITLVTELLLVKDLLTIRIIPMFEKKKYFVSIFYLISALIFLVMIPLFKGDNSYHPHIIAGAFFLIWINDSFAFIVGKNIGKHKLLERISPKKTIEGLLGGVFFAVIASYLLFYFTQLLSPMIWLFMSLIMSIFGTLGDLIQSKFKRQAGVKDSGTIMPGHGGIYDRLDSVIFAAPFLYAFLYIMTYVS